MAFHLLRRISLQGYCKQPLSRLLSYAMETTCPVISTRGPYCLATRKSPCLRCLYPHQLAQVKRIHLSCMTLPRQSFRWRTGRVSLLGAQRLGYRNQSSVTPHSELYSLVATATSHRTFPSRSSATHPFLLLPLAASGFAPISRHPCHSMRAVAAQAIACTRRYTSGTNKPLETVR